MKRLLTASITCLILFGCQKQGQIEFMDVVQDHKELTTETANALIASIRDDMQGIDDSDALKGAEELIERLEMMQDQSEAIFEYVFTAMPDQDLLSRLLKSKWKGNEDVTVYKENVP